jgi:hypothetical protein
VCDAGYSFTFVDIGAYGKNSGSCIFRRSVLRNKLSGNEFNIPDHRSVTGGSDNILPYVSVDGEAFCLSTHIIRPYSGKNLSTERRLYDSRHSGPRSFIECTVGILTNKWRIFHRPFNMSIDFAQNIVKAHVILHNFVRKRDGFRFEDTFNYKGLQDTVRLEASITGQTPLEICDKFPEYLTGAGDVPWQHDRV